MDLHPLNVGVAELDGEVEVGDEGGLKSDVGEHEFAVEDGELYVFGGDAEEYLLEVFVEQNAGQTFKYHLYYNLPSFEFHELPSC